VNTQTREEAIVIHPPTHDGAPEFVADTEEITTVIIADAATLSAALDEPRVPQTVTSVAPQERSTALDALRGLLMLSMVFSFAILANSGLPAWMYHMQFPPPTEQFQALAGLTWRDVIFPGFLFTMAAAVPLANTKLLASGVPYPAIIWRATKRAAVLFAFALIIGHTNPYWTGDGTKLGNVMAIVGFAACWPLLLAHRSDWNARYFRIFKVVGLAAVAAMLFALPAVYDASFSLYRKDNIIHALAFVGLAVVPIWLFTRNNLNARLTIIAVLAALKLAASYPGWVQEMWKTRSFLLEPWFVELLILAIPATAAGELLLDWMRVHKETTARAWPRARLIALATVSSLVTPVLLIGLYNRAVGLTTAAVLVLCACGLAFTYKPAQPRDQILAQLWRWGAVFLILGLLLEPFEGGIKKDPQTLSFVVLMTGFCFVSLVAVLIVCDLFRRGQAAAAPLVMAGRNPLLIYVLFTLFVSHVAYLAGVGGLFTDSPLPALVRAVFFTALTLSLVILATRKKIFWKA
jgi:predicted acyltransferase